MLQIIVLVIISWLLIWLFAKKSLSVLGMFPTKNRLKYFSILFFISAIISASAFFLRMLLIKEEYTLVQSITPLSILSELWNQFRMVLTEELLCRGALLYILITKIGSTKAIVISSFFFAILHWLNLGASGNLVQMIIVFSFTFIMGLLLAYSYARTFSLLVPLAIHYGWNVTQNYIFPDSLTGKHIFVLAAQQPIVTISYLSFFAMLLLPKISVIVVDYLIVKQHKPIELP